MGSCGRLWKVVGGCGRGKVIVGFMHFLCCSPLEQVATKFCKDTTSCQRLWLCKLVTSFVRRESNILYFITPFFSHDLSFWGFGWKKLTFSSHQAWASLINNVIVIMLYQLLNTTTLFLKIALLRGWIFMDGSYFLWKIIQFWGLVPSDHPDKMHLEEGWPAIRRRRQTVHFCQKIKISRPWNWTYKLLDEN